LLEAVANPNIDGVANFGAAIVLFAVSFFILWIVIVLVVAALLKYLFSDSGKK